MDKQLHARILIVEDEPMIAFTLQDLLVEAGFKVTYVAGKLGKALELIESAGCDAAIVDANLAGVSASPVALALAARGLPFIVLSGYSPEQLQGAFPAALFMKKPCRPAKIIEALKSILADRRSGEVRAAEPGFLGLAHGVQRIDLQRRT